MGGVNDRMGEGREGSGVKTEKAVRNRIAHMPFQGCCAGRLG